MANDSDDELFLTPPSSPVIQPFDGTESLDLAQWKLDILCHSYEKLEVRKKELELEEKRTLALLSKVALKLKKSSKSSNEKQSKPDDQSLLGIKTKPTISKKNVHSRPQDSRNVSIAGPSTFGPAKNTSTETIQQNTNPQRQNTLQPPSTSHSKGYLPVLLSPVLVRRKPPYDHNLLARRVECSEQADDLYRQFERRLDSRNERTGQLQPQSIGPTAYTIAGPSIAPAATPPTAPVAPAGSHIASSTAPHHSIHPTTHFFQNQLPTIAPKSWPNQTGYASGQQYSNHPYQSNKSNNVYTAADSHRPLAPKTTYYGHNYQSTGNSRSGWNQSHPTPGHQNRPPAPPGYATNNQWVQPKPYTIANNAYSPSTPPVAIRPYPQQRHLKPLSPAPASVNDGGASSSTPPPPPPIENKPTPPPPPPPIHTNDDKHHKSSSQSSTSTSTSKSAKINNPHSQPISKKATTSSSSNDTLKKQNYQSPLATFGIHPEQSTKPTQGSKRLDKPLCVFEAEGGTCNDDTCRSMHFRDF